MVYDRIKQNELYCFSHYKRLKVGSPTTLMIVLLIVVTLSTLLIMDFHCLHITLFN